MAKFEDNISPYISFVEGSAPSSPAATNFRLYYDSSDHLLKWKNSAGTVTALGGALASAMYKRTAGNYTTTSTSMVSVDGTNMALTITTGARRCLVGFVGNVGNSATGDFVEFDVDIDGTLQGNGTLGIITQNSTGSTAWNNMSFALLTAALSAGSHTFTLKWRVNGSGTLTMQGSNPPAWFYVMEQGG